MGPKTFKMDDLNYPNGMVTFYTDFKILSNISCFQTLDSYNTTTDRYYYTQENTTNITNNEDKARLNFDYSLYWSVVEHTNMVNLTEMSGYLNNLDDRTDSVSLLMMDYLKPGYYYYITVLLTCNITSSDDEYNNYNNKRNTYNLL